MCSCCATHDTCIVCHSSRKQKSHNLLTTWSITIIQKVGALPCWQLSTEVTCFPVTPLHYQAAPLAVKVRLLYNSKQLK